MKKGKSKKTKSWIVTTVAGKTAISSNSQMEPKLIPPATQESRQLKDGDGSNKLSLTASQEQMLLGTMLGDGAMRWDAKTFRGNPDYRSNHGYKQHKYNCRKYQVLSELALRPPKKKLNGGYGKWSSCWGTRNCPELRPIASLCLRLGRKNVTQAWLDRLTWEGIAWWIMDDGSRGRSTILFHTEGFSHKEVKLIQRWLLSLGVTTTMDRLKGRHGVKKYYYRLRTNPDSAYFLADKVRPYIFPEMSYKIDLPERKTVLTCYWCGDLFVPKSKKSRYAPTKKRDCCDAPFCRKTAHAVNNRKYTQKPEIQEVRRLQGRERYKNNPEKYRALALEYRKRHPEKIKARKQRYLAERRLIRQTSEWICQHCGLRELLGHRDPRTRYCPPCRQIVTLGMKQDYERRKKAARREKNKNTKVPCMTCGKLCRVNPDSGATSIVCGEKCRRERQNYLRQLRTKNLGLFPLI